MQAGGDYVGVSVVYFCHDGKGNFLMQKRGTNCRDEVGNWDIGAGQVDLPLSAEMVLREEIMQKYSTSVLQHEFLGYRDVYRHRNGKPAHWIALDFKVLVDKNRVKNGEPHKFDEIGWFTLDSLPSPVHPQLTDFIRRYGERLRI